MKDINYPLRKAYFRALQATGLPVYYQSLPNNINPDNYIVFRSISSGDDSTKSSAQTDTTITVEIHTLRDVINPGLDADLIATDVFNYIYAISQFVLPMDGVLMMSTKLEQDNTQNVQLNNQLAYINRFITFRHRIFVASSSGGGTVIVPVGEIDNYTYVADGGEVSITLPLTNKKILLFTKDGITFTPVSTTPVGKQVQYNVDGTFTWVIPAEPGEEIYIVYQNL